MRLSVRFLNRDFSEPLATPAGMTYGVSSYSWHAIGGPELANITAYGPERGLWELVEKLRCPVEIEDARGEVVWWGYVATVRVRVNRLAFSVDLDTMFNRVAVAYSLIEPGSQTPGVRATTTWTQDDDSVAVYGSKELLVSLSGATATQAEAIRTMVLAARRYPVPGVEPSLAEEEGSLSAVLQCRGWWQTLDWQYYSNPNTQNVETTDQIAAIVTAEGQFLTGAVIESPSGISSSEYRDGDATALIEIRELLRTGTSNGRRLLATVTKERRLRIYEEPEVGANDYLLSSTGELRNSYDVLVEGHKCPCGMWAQLKDVLPSSVDVSRLADPTRVFIEQSEYDARSLSLRLQPRGVLSPWDISRIAGTGL